LWKPGKYGLDPLFEERLLRKDRETLYAENGAIYTTTPQIINNRTDPVEGKVGHILMKEINSIHIDSWFDFKICELSIKEEMVGYNTPGLN
jgi:CMP-N-acetylneuraminic acid synthetase